MTDRNLAIRVALSAANKLSGPVSAAQRSAAALASQIKTTQSAIKGLDSQAKTFDRLNAALNRHTAAYESAKAKVKSLRAAFGPLNQLTEEQQRRLTEARRARDGLGRSLDKEKKKLQAVAAQLYRHGISIRQSDNATAQLTRRTESYNRQLVAQQRHLSALTRMQASYARAKETRGKLAGRGAAAVAAGGGALYASQRLLAPGRDFDAGMSSVQALTRLEKNDPRLAMLREQARALGASTHYTATEVASGQKFLAMAGFTPESIRAALPGVLNMALSGDMDLGETADIGSNVLTQFKLDAGQMDRVSDVLTGAFTRTNTDLRQLGETMTYAGPVAADLGVSLESMAAMAGAMADNGIRGSMAGTALRAGLTRLVAPVDRGAEALKTLGVRISDAQGRLRPMAEILKEAGQALRTFDQPSQARLKKDLFGEEAMVGMGAVMEAAVNGKYDALFNALMHAGGEADRNARIKVDNLTGDLRMLVSAWEDIGIQLQESVDSPLRRLTQGFTALLSSVGAWMKAHPQLTTGLTAAALVIGVMVTALGALALAAAAVIVPFATLRLGLFMLGGARGLGGLLPSVSGLTGGLGRLIPSLGGVGRSVRDWGPLFEGAAAKLGALRSRGALLGNALQMGLSRGAASAGRGLVMAFTQPGAALAVLGNGLRTLATSGLGMLFNVARAGITLLGGGLSLLLSPIALLVAALVAAGVLIWKYWEPLKAFFSGFLTGLIAGLAPLKDAFMAVFTPLAPVFDGIGHAIGQVWDWFTRLLTPVASSNASLEKCTAAGETFGKVVGAAISGLLWPIQQVAKGIGWLLEKLGAIPDATKAAADVANAMTPGNTGSAPKKPVVWEWDPQRKKMVARPWTPSAPAALQKTVEQANNTPPPAVKPVAPTFGSRVYSGKSGSEKSPSSSAGTVTENGRLGDIVFKHRPPVTAIDGLYQEPRLAMRPASLLTRLTQSAASLADTVLPPLAGIPVPVTPTRAAGASGGVISQDNYRFDLHFHGIEMSDRRALGELVKDKIRELMRENSTRRRSRLSDEE